MERVPLTRTGADRLREELERLRRTDRPEVIKSIAEARGHGDLRENAEYHAAREQQAFIEGWIKKIEAKLANSQISDVTAVDAQGKVIFGATVELVDVDTDEELRYQIVGEDEADIKAGRLSFSSPLARALIGKEEGDVATVRTPRGIRELEIGSVSYE